MAKYTEAQAKAVKKYLGNVGETKVRTSKDNMKRYREEAEKVGISLNQFIIDATEEKIRHQENSIAECFMEDGISLTTLDNMLYGAYMDHNPREPYEKEKHYSKRITEGYNTIKQEIVKYFEQNEL